MADPKGPSFSYILAGIKSKKSGAGEGARFMRAPSPAGILSEQYQGLICACALQHTVALMGSGGDAVHAGHAVAAGG